MLDATTGRWGSISNRSGS